jgi:hypothetical protein
MRIAHVLAALSLATLAASGCTKKESAPPPTAPAPAPTPVAPAPTPTPTVVAPAPVDPKTMLRAPAITKAIAFGGPTMTPTTVKGEAFEIPVGTKQLPSFAALKPFATLYTQSWEVSPRKFTEGFPGVNDRVEWFAIRWEGKINIKTGGAYTFKMVSDDGAKLYIDGTVVVDGDGSHGPKEASGNSSLNAGDHTIVVEYLQGPKGDVALQMWVSSPSMTPKILTTAF